MNLRKILIPSASFAGVILLLVFLAGGALGADHAAAGEPLPDVYQIVVDGAIDDGEVVAEPDEQFTDELREPAGYSVLENSQTARQMMVPLFRGGAVVAAAGASVGYSSVQTFGVSITKSWMLLSVLGSAGIGVYSVVRHVRR